jgi:hypothetical protein
MPVDSAITLTSDEVDMLNIALGFAIGAAFRDGNRHLAYGFVALANNINKDDPDYVPYKIPQGVAV